MISIDNENKCKIQFNKEFYSEETIKKACEDFKDFFDYELKGLELTISIKKNVEDLPYIFCNYVLELENEND